MNFKNLFFLISLCTGLQTFGAVKKSLRAEIDLRVKEHEANFGSWEPDGSEISGKGQKSPKRKVAEIVPAKSSKQSKIFAQSSVITPKQIERNMIVRLSMTRDLVARDKDKRTALMRAIIDDQPEVIDFLFTKRVETSHKDKDGKDFLDFIIEKPEHSKAKKAYRDFMNVFIDLIGEANTKKSKNYNSKIVPYLPDGVLFLIAEYGI